MEPGAASFADYGRAFRLPLAQLINDHRKSSS
jgi:hypothetical protein